MTEQDYIDLQDMLADDYDYDRQDEEQARVWDMYQDY